MRQNLKRSPDSGQHMTRVMSNKRKCTTVFKSANFMVLVMQRSLSGTLWQVVKAGLVRSTLRRWSKVNEIDSIQYIAILYLLRPLLLSHLGEFQVAAR